MSSTQCVDKLLPCIRQRAAPQSIWPVLCMVPEKAGVLSYLDVYLLMSSLYVFEEFQLRLSLQLDVSKHHTQFILAASRRLYCSCSQVAYQVNMLFIFVNG